MYFKSSTEIFAEFIVVISERLLSDIGYFMDCIEARSKQEAADSLILI